MTTNLFVIANVKQLRTDRSFRILLRFFPTSWGVGVLNSAIFNSVHNRVEIGTILGGLRNSGVSCQCAKIVEILILNLVLYTRTTWIYSVTRHKWQMQFVIGMPLTFFWGSDEPETRCAADPRHKPTHANSF